MKIITSFALILLLTSCDAPVPKALGVFQSKFKDCPDKPNCISSFSKSDSSHYIDPIDIKEPKDVAIKKILNIIKLYKSSKIITNQNDYIHIEVTSDIFKFVDDVEFYFGISGKIHMKSKSRLGHSDLGVNKKRLGEFIFKYHQSGAPL
jgi:uncharacterized protein (DUF1499 family)